MKTRHWLVLGLTAALAGGALTAATALAQDPDAMRNEARHMMEQAEHLMQAADRQEAMRHRERPEAGEVEFRIQHLREAAEHLDMAAYGEWADEVRRVAEDMERQLHEGDDGGPRDELAAHVEELTRAFRQLHRHVDELTGAVEDLRHRVDELSRER
jgi:uncharacterized coiled-coil DUF342 family protein